MPCPSSCKYFQRINGTSSQRLDEPLRPYFAKSVFAWPSDALDKEIRGSARQWTVKRNERRREVKTT
jgi:hypothetical protein